MKKFFYYALSFLLPIVFLLGLGFYLGITPFGNSNLAVSDLGTQYLPFFAYLRQIASGHANVFYSFSIGMGAKVLPLAAYYLLSPFNLLFLVFPNQDVDVLVNLVIMLKIACISSAMLYYLEKTYKKLEFSQLAFSFAYALSSFVAIYLTNLMWLDALIFLPLVTLSLQRLINKKKGLAFSLLIFLSIVTNYYMGYMMCLFAVFYYIYWTLKNTDCASVKEYLQKTKQDLIRFIQYAFLGGAMSAFILIPALVGMMHTGKTEFSLLTFLPYPNFLTDIFVQLGLDNTNFASRLYHLPAIYAGVLPVFLVILYFKLPFTRKEKWLKFYLLTTLFLSFFIQTINAVWHMFQRTAGFPFRNSYMFSFVVLIIAYEAWQRREEISKKMIVCTLFSLLILLSIGYISANLGFGYYGVFDLTPNIYLYVWSIVLFLLASFLLLNKHKKVVVGLILAFFFLDSSANFAQMVAQIPFGQRSSFENYQKKLADSLPQGDSSVLLRVQNNLTKEHSGYNDALLQSFYGVSNYSSTLDEGLRVTLQNLGLFSKNERRIMDKGLTAFTSFLLNVNYEILADGQIQQINPQQSSIAYLFPDWTNLHLETKEPFSNQNRLAKSIMQDGTFSLFDRQVMQNKVTNVWTTKASSTGQLYIYLRGKEEVLVEVWVNGQRERVQVQANRPALLQLADVKQGDQIELKITGYHNANIPEDAVQILKTEELNQVLERMNQKKVQLDYDARQNIFSGTIETAQDSHLFLSIPYDSQWQVLLKGKEVPVKATLDETFMSVPIPAGKHEIEIRFTHSLFKLSAGISIAATLMLMVLSIYHQKKE